MRPRSAPNDAGERRFRNLRFPPQFARKSSQDKAQPTYAHVSRVDREESEARRANNRRMKNLDPNTRVQLLLLFLDKLIDVLLMLLG